MSGESVRRIDGYVKPLRRRPLVFMRRGFPLDVARDGRETARHAHPRHVLAELFWRHGSHALVAAVPSML